MNEVWGREKKKGQERDMQTEKRRKELKEWKKGSKYLRETRVKKAKMKIMQINENAKKGRNKN